MFYQYETIVFGAFILDSMIEYVIISRQLEQGRFILSNYDNVYTVRTMSFVTPYTLY